MMSFTDPEITARIQKLKNRFEEIDTPIHDSENDTGEKPSEEDLFSRHAIIKIAVISNLLNTLENSLDQISICFEVSRAMFFYKDEIVCNPSFWAEERAVNQMLCSNNFKMAIADMQSAGTKLDAEVSVLQAQQGSNQDFVSKTLALVERYQQLIGRFHEASTFLTEMEARQKGNLPLYDADQHTSIGEGSPEKYLKSLHQKSSDNANRAIALNMDLAEDFLASVHFAKIIAGTYAPEESEQIALILNRFEALEDARDNRYGFTQLRFE